MYIYPLKRLYKANINLGLLSSIMLPPPPPPLPVLMLTPSLLQDSSSWLPGVTVYRAIYYWPFQGRIWSLYKARSPLIRQLCTSLYILMPSLYNLGVRWQVTYILYTLALAQATACFYHIIRYLGTLAERIGIVNGVIIYPATPYKTRMEVITVDLYTYHKQGLVAIVGIVQQRHCY